MMLIELFIPKGALTEDQRLQLAKRLVTEFVMEGEQDAPPEVLESYRSLSHVLVQESPQWVVGGRLVGADEPPRYFVRVSVPQAWRKAMSPEVISRVTRILAQVDADPERLYREPAAMIHVVGIAEGSVGFLGEATTSTDLVRMITKPFHENPRRDAIVEAAKPGTAVDPICGMTVTLDDRAITLERDGKTYGFCSGGCRQVFLEDHPTGAPN